MEPLNVVCIKWGTKYGPEYVTRLRNMASRYVPCHRFICFTDDPVEGVECRALPSDFPTWWSKVGLFKPGELFGNTLYLDLDVVLTGSIKPFLGAFYSDPTKLWTLDDFGYPLTNPREGIGPETQRLLGGAGTVNSSVMIWRNDTCRKVWEDFTPEVMKELHGDQNWITRCLWPDTIRLLPEGIAGSYKYGKGKKFPVTVFHGEPKPHQVNGWVADAWT